MNERAETSAPRKGRPRHGRASGRLHPNR
jgi:hypothetical protein